MRILDDLMIKHLYPKMVSMPLHKFSLFFQFLNVHAYLISFARIFRIRLEGKKILQLANREQVF